MGRSPVANGLNLATARRLEQAQAFARDLLGIEVALPLVVDFQVRPFNRVHGPNVGSLEVAVGWRLWCEQRGVGSLDPQFGRSNWLLWFSVSMGTGGSADGGRPDLTLNRSEFTVSRTLGATGDCDRTENDRDGETHWDR
jgi:hypothetical protein